tara:strand:- start:572 stop:1006 length:435 start_codon:yes stop_codon:yes gene_type:complete
MHNTFQNSLFYIIVFTLTYFLFVYPFEILNEFLFLEREERRISFLYTLVISSMLILYYRYQNKFRYLKFLVNEGVGIGFISFIYVNILMFLNLFFKINSFYAGITVMILIFVTFVLSFYFKLLFNINRIIALFNDIMRANIISK